MDELMADPPARIPQLQPADWTEEAREVFGALGRVQTGRAPDASSGAPEAALRNHVLRTFAQYPSLTKSYLNFNGFLLSSELSLPIRLRQIAIQRVAWIRHCPYMWSSHLRVSLPVGLTRDDFEAIKAGENSPHWSEGERTVVAAVDALVERSYLSDETWNKLAERLDRKQLMDLIFVVGCYTMLSMVFNTLQIEREPELRALADEYGAPERAG